MKTFTSKHALSNDDSSADDVQLPRIHYGDFWNFNSHGKILL